MLSAARTLCFRRQVPSYNYLSVFGRPIDSLALNSLIEFNAEVLRYASVEYALLPLESVFLGGMALRLLLEVPSLLVKDMHYQNYGSRKLHGFISKVFLVDLERDISFYDIEGVKANTWRAYYQPSQLAKYLINGYLLVGVGRALNTLINDQRYNNFLMLDPSVATLDPTYVSPILVMLLNYALLKRSTHPFLVHIRQHSLMAWNIAFVSGLLFVAMPSLFNSTYLGFVSMHLIVRMFKKLHTRYKEASLRRMFQS